MLDLHHDALILAVGEVARLCHNAVESGPFEDLEPSIRKLERIGGRGQQYRRRGRGKHLLQNFAAAGKWLLHKGLVTERKQVERDEGCRSLERQLLHAGCGWVDALKQGFEVEGIARHDHDLAVEHASLRQARTHRLNDFREIARQRLFVATAEFDLVTVAKDDAAEAVPLRFVDHARRNSRLRFREHRFDRWHHRKLHRRTSYRA